MIPEKSIRHIVREIFETNVSVSWSSNSAKETGLFEVNSTQYKVEIEYFNDLLNISNKLSVFGFKFYSKDKYGNWSIILIKKSQNAMKVFGTLKSVILEFIQKKKPDIVFYIASDEKRINIYSKMTHLLVDITGYNHREDKIEDTAIFSVSKPNIDLNSIFEELKAKSEFGDWINKD